MFDQLPSLISTQRTTITRFGEPDLPNAFELHQLDEVNRYIPYNNWTTYQDALDWYERVQGLRSKQAAEQYVIKLLTQDRFIGTCLVFGFNPQHASAEFGYVLHPDYWGQGYMLEAMTEFTSSLVSCLNLKTLYASVESPNLASQSLLKKLQFSLVKEVTEDNGIVLGKWAKTC